MVVIILQSPSLLGGRPHRNIVSELKLPKQFMARV